jgi:nitroreductase
MGEYMIIDIMKQRSSVKHFSNKEVSENDLKKILEAGRLSPSGGNEQPWIFGVIRDKNKINEVSKIAYNQEWIKSANVLIVLCTTIVEDERDGRGIQIRRFPEYKSEIENMNKELYSSLNSEEHQTKIPGTIIMLQAFELGIKSRWISYFKVKELAKLVKLPALCIPSELIALGYSDEEIQKNSKKLYEEIVFYEEYSK